MPKAPLEQRLAAALVAIEEDLLDIQKKLRTQKLEPEEVSVMIYLARTTAAAIIRGEAYDE